MNKIINIGELGNESQNEIFTGDNFESFLNNMPPMSEKEVLKIKNSTINILSNCIPSRIEEPLDETNTGLVIGYIQSGKTMSFTSLIALASDNDYKLVILLAGTTRILLQQTVDRLKNDLDDRNEYVIIPEASMKDSSKISSVINNKKRNRIIILPILKHHTHIQKLIDLFSDSSSLKMSFKKRGVLIIDDEADQASLNGFARKNYKASKNKDSKNNVEVDQDDFSTTYNRITQLRSSFINHSYIQYTATPQANLLLSHRDLLKPTWCEVLDAGNKYTGGRRFFNDEKDLIEEIDKENFKNQSDPEMPSTLREAFRLFLIESAIIGYEYEGKERKRKKLELTSMMVHADRLIEVNNIYLRWLRSYNKNIFRDLKNNEEECLEDFRNAYLKVEVKLKDYFTSFPSFNEVIDKVTYWVLEELSFWFVAGQESNEVDWSSDRHHVLIGGQKLDRGFTVKNLIVTYMPRSTKSKSSADTVEQRCRFFGYKKDYIEACKVYLPQESIIEFEDYLEYENHLRDFLKVYSIDEFYNNGRLMKLSNKLNPTSLNKIAGELFRSDFREFNYLQPDFIYKSQNENEINKYINKSEDLGVLKPINNSETTHDNMHKIYQSSVSNTINLFAKIKFKSNKETTRKNHFISVLEKLTKNEKVWVIKMAYKRDLDGGRPRTFKSDGRIKSLASNYPPSFGDRKLLISVNDYQGFNKEYNFEPIIQIHKIKVKKKIGNPTYIKKYENESIDVIAMIYPDKSNSTYMSVYYD